MMSYFFGALSVNVCMFLNGMLMIELLKVLDFNMNVCLLFVLVVSCYWNMCLNK